jgi:hypothetical protein
VVRQASTTGGVNATQAKLVVKQSTAGGASANAPAAAGAQSAGGQVAGAQAAGAQVAGGQAAGGAAQAAAKPVATAQKAAQPAAKAVAKATTPVTVDPTVLVGAWQASNKDIADRETVMQLDIADDGTATLRIQTRGQEPFAVTLPYTVEKGAFTMGEGDQQMTLGTVASASEESLILKRDNATITFSKI